MHIDREKYILSGHWKLWVIQFGWYRFSEKFRIPIPLYNIRTIWTPFWNSICITVCQNANCQYWHFDSGGVTTHHNVWILMKLQNKPLRVCKITIMVRELCWNRLGSGRAAFSPRNVGPNEATTSLRLVSTCSLCSLIYEVISLWVIIVTKFTSLAQPLRFSVHFWHTEI